MIEKRYLDALKIICVRLAEGPANWVVTGSLGMALQGMGVTVHDREAI